MRNTLSANSLTERLERWRDFNDAALELAGDSSSSADIEGLKGSLTSFFTARLIGACEMRAVREAQRTGSGTKHGDYVIITVTDKDADECESDLASILGDTAGAEIHKIPWWGVIPYRAAARNAAVFGQRAGALSKLAMQNSCDRPRVFITSLRALLSPVPPPEYIRSLSVTLRKGQQIDTVSLADRLTGLGYMRVPRVGMRGEFALRGEVLDIFMPGDGSAVRVVFDFDQIDQIKSFDAETQSASAERFDRITLHPMKEVIWTEDLVRKLGDELSAANEGGIENDFASYDARKRTTASAADGDRKAPAENTVAAEKDASREQIPSGTGVRLAFTRDALRQKDALLEELMSSGGGEGEELFYGLLWDKKHSVLDYVRDGTPVICYDWDRLKNAVMALRNEYEVSYRTARLSMPVLPPADMLLDFRRLGEETGRVLRFRSLETEENAVSADSGLRIKTYRMQCETSRSFFGNINYFKEELRSLQGQGWRIYIFADNANQSLRIKEILKEFIDADGQDTDTSFYPVQVLPLAINEGFSVTDEKILVVQENEIFGRRRNAPASTRRAQSHAIDTFVELSPGDYVVHVNFGIGLFKGIERVKTKGFSHGEPHGVTERDYIKLEYADQEIAFVPIEQVNLVQRYIGNENERPRLDKIGGKSWSARKSKVKAQVEEMAEKLIDLYSKRQASRGFPFPPDTEWQAAFEAAFPYEDTPDQITAAREIKADMERPVPMDRLVCGDVGYGKTEIAMRAAFKAVMGGKQVAFMAPTTILAEQHYESCMERFKNFPVTIAQMSRFVSAGEQKKILARLASGEVDILIGTHRIIQKDVIFKDLGLMIIDEEQRFGVKDKERLKVLKNNIDCLAMSATPIPRTLHMSLLKIRDMSLLTTPPQNRQPIETAIEPYDDEKIARAIRREAERGGQVFYLHNRVETLDDTRIKLERLVPELLIDVAHGQMSADELDDIFRRFKMGGFHVLVATTIIENGIDIPNVNTIIIDRADMYGVSQLYQLRGRVGRSDRKAYAYLFYPESKSLSEVAMKRLQVISDFTELGSGFKIAMKDMEIRGAGNLLGRDQSGEVCAVGFEMYLSLLSAAIERLTTSGWHAQEEVLMELEYTGFIPDTYINDPQTKMELYKKIAAISSEQELRSMYAEFFDRFGPVPDEVESLLSLAKIRIICARLSISSLKEKQGVVHITFSDVSKVSINKVLRLIKLSAGRVKLNPAAPDQITLQTGSIDLASKADFIKEKLEALA